MDNKSLNQLLNYNNSVRNDGTATNLNSVKNIYNREESLDLTSNSTRIVDSLKGYDAKPLNDFKKFIYYPTTTSFLAGENDAKQVSNSFKYLLNKK